MNAPHVLDDLPLWVGGDLAPQEQQRVDQHLAGCRTCRVAAEALQASQAWLREPLEPAFTAEEQARFRQEVMDRIRAHPARVRLFRFQVLAPVLSSLRSTLAYRSYTQAISFVLRAATGEQSAKGRGSLEGLRLDKTGQGEVRVDYFIRAIGVEGQEAGPARLTLKGFSLEAVNQTSKESLASLTTDLTFKDGETVVVGTSAFKDKGLIVVVSAKLLN